jgi:hypothetical protein
MMVTACQVAREGSKVADYTFGSADNEHTEHLSLLKLVVPVDTTLQVCLYFFRCLYAEGMGCVMERVGEPLG